MSGWPWDSDEDQASDNFNQGQTDGANGNIIDDAIRGALDGLLNHDYENGYDQGQKDRDK